jgi:exportin-1
MLNTFKNSESATAFYKAYYLQLLREVFAVLTDTFHKPGFVLQAHILHHLFSVVQSDVIKAPLWDDSLGPSAYPTNAAFIQSHVAEMLSTSFPNLRPQQVQAAVVGMMELKEISSFKQHLRDFLVQSNKFMDQNNAELYAEEVAAAKKAEIERMSQIPGLLQDQDDLGDNVDSD